MFGRSCSETLNLFLGTKTLPAFLPLLVLLLFSFIKIILLLPDSNFLNLLSCTGRKGTAVAFVNEKCSYLHDLYDILVEAKQETPLWFEEMVRSARRMGGKGSGASRRRDDRFGGSDIRSEDVGKAKEGPAGGSNLFTKGPPRVELPVGRSPDAFGTSGLEDAW